MSSMARFVSPRKRLKSPTVIWSSRDAVSNVPSVYASNTWRVHARLRSAWLFMGCSFSTSPEARKLQVNKQADQIHCCLFRGGHTYSDVPAHLVSALNDPQAQTEGPPSQFGQTTIRYCRLEDQRCQQFLIVLRLQNSASACSNCRSAQPLSKAVCCPW